LDLRIITDESFSTLALQHPNPPFTPRTKNVICQTDTERILKNQVSLLLKMIPREYLWLNNFLNKWNYHKHLFCLTSSDKSSMQTRELVTGVCRSEE